MKTINTVTGTITADKLGTTLMHEHLMVGWGGWELDCTAPRFERKEALKFATDRLKELRDLGLGTFLDPCPTDIGRDVNFMAEAAGAADIVFARKRLLEHCQDAGLPHRRTDDFADALREWQAFAAASPGARAPIGAEALDG